MIKQSSNSKKVFNNVYELLELYINYFFHLIRISLVFILISFVVRAAFLYNFANSSDLTENLKYIPKALIMGLRFDLSSLSYFYSIPLLLFPLVSLLNSRRILSGFNQVFRVYLLLILSFFTFLSFIDFGYYAYFQDRINVLVFGLFEDDTVALIKTMWKNYPVIKIIVLLAISVISYRKLILWSEKKYINFQLKRIPTFIIGMLFVVPFVINGLSARGSFGLFPLGPMDTAISKSSLINIAAFNSAHSLARAIKLKKQNLTTWDSNIKYFGYSENIKKAFSDFYKIPEHKLPSDLLSLLKRKSPKNKWAENTKPHVIIIMMESFSAHWIKFHNEKFNLLGSLEKHFNEDYLFTHFLPSTGSTIGSLGAFLIGMPHRPIGPFLTESNFLQVSFRSSIANTYKKAGYHTEFIYGGNEGWRDIGKFAKHQGFDRIVGEVGIKESLNKNLETHDWGIYDEDLFSYIENKLNNENSPQFLMVMTTTNHPPYQIPSNYKKLPLEIPDSLKRTIITDQNIAEDRFATYQYSSQMLGNFLTTIKNSKLSDKLIIAVTGDHSFFLTNFGEDEVLQKWSVPFYLYVPKEIKRKYDSSTFGAHHDIAPTLYDLSLSEKEYYSIGHNLLKDTNNVAMHFSNLSISKQGAVISWKDHYTSLTWENDVPGQKSRLVPNTTNSVNFENLDKNYRSAMSILDYYFESERKRDKHE